MPTIEFDRPDRFIAGTVGPPGSRTFFLQVVQGRRVVSVSLEKEQVAVLAERVNDLLDELAVDEDLPVAKEDNDPLTPPIEDEFRVSTLSLAWEPERQVLVIEAHDKQVELEPTDDGEELREVTDPDDQLVRVMIGPAEAREFARRGLAAVEDGRPSCPFCGGPLDPSGHICPRANGYRR
ncbi:DUF3090 domain-containing protein [Flexivirga sp. B27]